MMSGLKPAAGHEVVWLYWYSCVITVTSLTGWIVKYNNNKVSRLVVREDATVSQCFFCDALVVLEVLGSQPSS